MSMENVIPKRDPKSASPTDKTTRLKLIEAGMKYALFALVYRKVLEEKSGTEGVQQHLTWVSHSIDEKLKQLPDNLREHTRKYAVDIFGEMISELELAVGRAPKNAEEERRLATIQRLMADVSGPKPGERVN
ncbi:hypothetical protein [Microvirga lotononidis]|uniref:Uncharacterized protein n=1 Tax=Microvirga lotononidis TaxID=864069 RepID=I4YRP4_9HYPH|nr:hypothetical protein [Microvirga lotononidis]EIM26636.1 hypothetical protein MicloDRAFT_00031850 [Microvirga lotononidis]WQO32079.1 hypothetical protein U0023_35350 [Microvirga lotononidis]